MFSSLRGFESGAVRFTSRNFPLRTLAREMDDEAYHSGNLPSREISEDVSGQSSAGKPGRMNTRLGEPSPNSVAPEEPIKTIKWTARDKLSVHKLIVRRRAREMIRFLHCHCRPSL